MFTFFQDTDIQQMRPAILGLNAPYNFACNLCGKVCGDFECSDCIEITTQYLSHAPPQDYTDEARMTHLNRRFSKRDIKALFGVDVEPNGRLDMFSHHKLAKRREETALPEGIMFRLVYEPKPVEKAVVKQTDLTRLLFGE